MASLNRLASNWSRVEREKLNTNWAIIENYLSNLQRQINLLTGDVNVQELIDKINDIFNQGNVIIDDLETALQEATTVIANAQNATTDANNATQEALNAINDMQAFINQFGNAETYDNSKFYKINNMVEFNGSGFICIKDTQGNTPPILPTKRNEWWQLIAQRGVDGTGSVSKVAGKSPDVDGNVNLIAQDIGAVSRADFNAHLADAIACFGDSFTRTVSDVNEPGVREQFETYLFFDLVCDTLKPIYKKNNGLSGSRIETLFRTLNASVRNDVHFKKNIINVGFNDLTDYKGIAFANETIANSIQSACVYLKTRNRKSVYKPNDWSWLDIDWLGHEIGATGKVGIRYTDSRVPIEFVFEGRHLVIFTVDNLSSGTYLVKSDGQEVFNADIKREKRSAYFYCLKIDCGSVGTHTIQFSSPNGRCYISGYGEYDESIEVYVNELTKRIDTSYDPDTVAINNLITNRIKDLNDANIKVVKMTNYLPSIYVGTDNLHPNILGHMKIAENILNTIIK